MKIDTVSLRVTGLKNEYPSFSKMWSQSIGEDVVKEDFTCITHTIEQEIIDRIMKGERFQIRGRNIHGEYFIMFVYDMGGEDD